MAPFLAKEKFFSAEIEDNQLVGWAQQGDKNAQEDVIARYANLVRTKARAYYLIGADGDDLVQEGMIGLYKAMRDYQEDRQSSFRTFAELCITRQIITAIKTASRQKHSPLNFYVSLNKGADEEGKEETTELFSFDQNPETLVIGREEMKLFDRMIGQVLSPLEREVLQRYIAGQTYLDMAGELKKPVKAVDNAIQRIRRKIAKSLFNGN